MRIITVFLHISADKPDIVINVTCQSVEPSVLAKNSNLVRDRHFGLA